MIFILVLLCSTVIIFSEIWKRHEIWKSALWNWWVDCFIASSIKWCDILGAHSESILPFMQYFLSFQKAVFFGFLVSCLLQSQSPLILLVGLLWGISRKFLLSLEWYCQSQVGYLIWVIDCWRDDHEFSWNNFCFIVLKEFL